MADAPRVPDVPEFDADNPLWLSTQAIAGLLGVSEARVKQLRQRHSHAVVRVSRRLWWWAPYFHAVRVLAATQDSPNTDSPDHRIKELTIEKMERAAAKERRELVEAGAMRVLFGRMAQPLSRELTIAQREAPDIARRLVAAIDEAEGILKAEFNGHG